MVPADVLWRSDHPTTTKVPGMLDEAVQSVDKKLVKTLRSTSSASVAGLEADEGYRGPLWLLYFSAPNAPETPSSDLDRASDLGRGGGI